MVVSPLRRARETAAAFGRPVEVDERWIELDYGEFDGRPIVDVPPDLWPTWRADPHFAPPGGESLVTLGVRVRGACEELLDEARERDVVVVSHVSPIKAAIAWALGVGDEVAWRLFVQVASIARVDDRAGRSDAALVQRGRRAVAQLNAGRTSSASSRRWSRSCRSSTWK